MLTLTIGATEVYDEETMTFSSDGGSVVCLEHSLVSLSKWESIHQRPFLSQQKMTAEETRSYILCMILTPIPDDLFGKMTSEHYTAINEYIDSKQSATTFREMPEEKGRRGEIVTSELIYYWLVAFNIDWEAQHWHLNRLLALVRVCNVKNGKPKKMSKGELAAQRKKLNDERRAKYGTKG